MNYNYSHFHNFEVEAVLAVDPYFLFVLNHMNFVAEDRTSMKALADNFWDQILHYKVTSHA